MNTKIFVKAGEKGNFVMKIVHNFYLFIYLFIYLLSIFIFLKIDCLADVVQMGTHNLGFGAKLRKLNTPVDPSFTR